MRVFVVWTPHLSQQPIPQHDCTWFVKTAFELVLNFAGLYRGVGLYIHTAARLADTKRIWQPTPCAVCLAALCAVSVLCIMLTDSRENVETSSLLAAKAQSPTHYLVPPTHIPNGIRTEVGCFRILTFA